MTIELHGYRYSVYLRIVAMTLTEKSVAWTHVEVDPFAETIPQAYLALNPFGRVPTLVHDGFVLYETTAIARGQDPRLGLCAKPLLLRLLRRHGAPSGEDAVVAAIHRRRQVHRRRHAD